MKLSRRLAAATLALLVVAATPSFAGQERSRGRDRAPDRGAGQRATPGNRAVPRGSVRPAPLPNRGTPYRNYRSYGPRTRHNLYYGYPSYYYGYPRYYGSFSYGYPYGYGYPYAYGSRGYGYPDYYAAYPGRIYGGVRIDLPERDAEVFVDGYYAGIVDDFDGVLQQLNLEPGAHRIEIVLDGFEPVAFDVNVEPGRTITYRTRLRPGP